HINKYNLNFGIFEQGFLARKPELPALYQRVFCPYDIILRPLLFLIIRPCRFAGRLTINQQLLTVTQMPVVKMAKREISPIIFAKRVIIQGI
ncbi:MAG: hypothetical protein LBP78_01450, partial [Acidaminococcales bacterium]|nr:hypothetical protein [Acidaminococcales bacterium]